MESKELNTNPNVHKLYKSEKIFIDLDTNEIEFEI